MRNQTSMCRAAGLAALALLAGLPTHQANATEGYFTLGHSPGQRALAGAGVARGFEAMSATINPAGVANVGGQMQVGMELFMPYRGYEGTSTGFVPAGVVDSGTNFFPVPSFAYNKSLDSGGVLNFAAYGNGGMNTTYPSGLGGCGDVFCAGPAGVDLMQLFVSATYAKKIGAVSFGIAPTLAAQRFKANGLAAFSGISVDPSALSDNGYDMSWGFGVRAGIEVELSPSLRFGVAGQSRMQMSKLDSYAGLFENGGEFDIPAALSAGIALEASPELTVMLDWRRVFYSKVGAIGNAGNAGPLGAPGGAGFGWDDVDSVKLGIEWRQSDTMTWRAGFAHNTNPIGPEDVTFNILAPGVVQDHISFGGTRKLNDRDALDFSISYVPETKVSGPETTPSGPTGGTVELNMHQFSISAGWTRTF